ncbi:3D domain-containing protein [Salegentibacter chungangensis]|uniref:3D domain-containing protein n=1 Tax=Salegentibacter chungangensis TaxID=1335724 RepID=A0ABW3NTI6_9FLAO
MKIIHSFLLISLIYIAFGFTSCDFGNKKLKASDKVWDTLEVSVSAYNSVPYQTGAGGANITAWGDTLKPGDKVIAVSRDLLEKGLDYNTPVKIQGFDGVFLVKDKMHYRWKNKIDIYMGEDIQKARNFGRKKLCVYFEKEPDSLAKN